jgi:hypothetical protein
MSALPPKADIDHYGRDVCFVPKADMLAPRLTALPFETTVAGKRRSVTAFCHTANASGALSWA